jgi:hypothetical protein
MKDRERWMDLCRQAAVEQDPDKLLALVQEIDRLLAEKSNRLLGVHEKKDKDAV